MKKITIDVTGMKKVSKPIAKKEFERGKLVIMMPKAVVKLGDSYLKTSSNKWEIESFDKDTEDYKKYLGDDDLGKTLYYYIGV